MMGTLVADSDDSSAKSSSNSQVFKRLQFVYLTGYVLAAAGNNLQGSYRYALYDSYGLQRSTIQRIYLATSISTLFLGTLTSSLADKYGRRSACILCGLLYILCCIALNINILWVLYLGSVSRGIAHSLYNTNFEAWLIQDHHNSGLSTDSLKQILRDAFVLSSVAAIATGFVSQFSAELFGYVAPFDIAIGIYVIMIVFILTQWTENHGDKEASAATSFVSAFQALRNDPRIVLVGLITAFIDATLYIFVIEWTPAMERAHTWTIYEPLPLGIIFSCLTVQPAVLVSFFVYEFCIGVYQPSISLLRSQYLPNSARATLMNYFRIPRFFLMFVATFWHLPLAVIFAYCSAMLFAAFVCLLILRSMKAPEEHIVPSENVVLLPQTTTESSGGIDNKNIPINMNSE
ncbi:unnamed protein product [Adineta steineri]|uniref:Uncharacterized protein n=1 Tax=Adineta steineri TaxID=433720 RepID=A0A815EMY4_9BILA|nr:unnamed protein product [Adineta steineri]CAF3820277.1 unnamed protein product [Adineta steineri]